MTFFTRLTTLFSNRPRNWDYTRAPGCKKRVVIRRRLTGSCTIYSTIAKFAQPRAFITDTDGAFKSSVFGPPSTRVYDLVGGLTTPTTLFLTIFIARVWCRL